MDLDGPGGAGHRALVLGCHGGVGRAALALLERSGPGGRLRERLAEVVLADRRAPPGPVPLRGARLLPPTDVGSAADLGRLIREHRITQVIDLSSIDTVECTQVCDDLGADFLCTSVEEWPGHQPLTTDESISRLLPPRRPLLARRGHLVGSGCNPGIVNALVFAAVERFARRVGVPSTVEALELHAVLITEEDTTRDERAAPDPDLFSMTWSPWHCLEELFEPRAFAAERGKVVSLGHAPTERCYRARCGDRVIAGMAVPHEEVVTLAERLPGVEIAFLYRLPPAARRALAAHPGRRAVRAWRTHRLYPPWSTDLAGGDRVGVLLCSRRFGELWLGFDTPVARGLPLGTNATQLQVAAGVLAGWSQLGERRGIHFVEDLDGRASLDAAIEVLGPLVTVHDATTPSAPLSDRLQPERVELG
jgi:saccharopine dehydrogenase-like NADP-dependent oxidoreductase